MERLSKIAIYMGMIIVCSIFAMFAISIMPLVVSQVENNWEDVLPDKSDEAIKRLFYETDSYKAFNTKYPDNGEYYVSYGDGRGRLEVTAMNFESYNTLHLRLEYEKRTDSVMEDVRCENQKNNQSYSVLGTLAAQFIENIDCLNNAGLIDAPSNLVDEDGNPVPIRDNPVIIDQYD